MISTEFSRETLTLVCSTEHPRLQGKVDITQLYTERFCGLNSAIPYIMRRQVELSRLFKERNFIFSSDSVMAILSIIKTQNPLALCLPLC